MRALFSSSCYKSLNRTMSRTLLTNPIAPLQPVPSDIMVSQSISPFHITEVAKAAGILESEFEPYGRYKGKVRMHLIILFVLTSHVLTVT
jgi:hypothetical protein